MFHVVTELNNLGNVTNTATSISRTLTTYNIKLFKITRKKR
jgi:hypothetical protein